MDQIIKKSINDLNEILPKEKKIIYQDSSLLIGKQSNLESIDLVNLFIFVEKNLKEEKKLTLTFDDMLQNIDQLKTIKTFKSYLIKKFQNEKK
mgnify:CR=1 FL=1|tara:strand:+ start:170 stop:448 length:279 start_codon:yes stop_codon:yes gene_type:complete